GRKVAGEAVPSGCPSRAVRPDGEPPPAGHQAESGRGVLLLLCDTDYQAGSAGELQGALPAASRERDEAPPGDPVRRLSAAQPEGLAHRQPPAVLEEDGDPVAGPTHISHPLRYQRAQIRYHPPLQATRGRRV